MIEDFLGSSEMVQNIAEVFLHIDDQAVKRLVKLPIINYQNKSAQKTIVLTICTFQGPD